MATMHSRMLVFLFLMILPTLIAEHDADEEETLITYTCDSTELLILYNRSNEDVKMHCSTPVICGKERTCVRSIGPACKEKFQYLAGVDEASDGSVRSTCCQITPLIDGEELCYDTVIFDQTGIGQQMQNVTMSPKPEASTSTTMLTIAIALYGHAIGTTLPWLPPRSGGNAENNSMPAMNAEQAKADIMLFDLKERRTAEEFIKGIEKIQNGYRIKICKLQCGHLALLEDPTSPGGPIKSSSTNATSTTALTSTASTSTSSTGTSSTVTLSTSTASSSSPTISTSSITVPTSTISTTSTSISTASSTSSTAVPSTYPTLPITSNTTDQVQQSTPQNDENDGVITHDKDGRLKRILGDCRNGFGDCQFQCRSITGVNFINAYCSSRIQRKPQRENSFTGDRDIILKEPERCTCIERKVENPSTSTELPQRAPRVGNGQGCFSGDMIVETPSGQKRMDQLHVGDEVQVLTSETQRKFQPVEWFYHRDLDHMIQFVNIKTKSGRYLSLTPNHLIPLVPCNARVVNLQEMDSILESTTFFASRARIGLCVASLTEDGRNFMPDQIIDVNRERKRGVFSPITSHGTIVVNGVQTSCYSSLENQALQRTVHKILIRIYHAMQSIWHWRTDTKSVNAMEDKDVPIVLALLLRLAKAILPWYVYV